jgi:hypothetical protein
MKRTKTIEYAFTVGRDSKGLLHALMISPSKEPTPDILMIFGFDPEKPDKSGGKVIPGNSVIRRDSLRGYMKRLKDFTSGGVGPDLPEPSIMLVPAQPIPGERKYVLVYGKATVTEDVPEDEMFQFPEGTFSGDMTKWGPTDFYTNVEEQIVAAFRSGKCWETPWGGCRKEILSSQFSFDGKTLTAQVSVSDDFDTEGMGEASFVPSQSMTDDEFLAALEKAGSEAHEGACDVQKDNRCYCGYSVGKMDGKKVPWQFTYLVNVSGFDTPAGDNYHRFGWQEVETEDDQDMDACPEEIPAAVAKQLQKGMEQMRPLVRCKGWGAKIWND